MQPGHSWTKTIAWSGWINQPPAFLSPEPTAESANGAFVVTSQLDPTGLSASFQIQSPLSYNLKEAQTELQFGQPNGLSYTITNTSAEPVTLNLPPADFVVMSKGSTIWESDPGAASEPDVSETLQPGQSLSATATWDGMANEGPLAGTDVFDNSNDYLNVSALGLPTATDVAFKVDDPLSATVTAAGGTPGANGGETFGAGQSIVFTAMETNTSDLPVTILNTDENFGMQYGVSIPPHSIRYSSASCT